MNSKLLLTGTSVIAVVLGSYYFFNDHQLNHLNGGVAPRHPASAIEKQPVVTSTPSGAKQTGSLHEVKRSNTAEHFRDATDYREFLASLLNSAQNGDRDAQYYVSAALRFCNVGYRSYFDRGNKRRRTLDEAMQHATQLPGFSSDEARNVYDKCHVLKEGDASQFGSADEWLAASAAAGQPLAQATRAIDLFLQSKIAVADGSGTLSASGKDPAELRRSSITLAMEAIKSKDPEVLWKMGDMQTAVTDSWSEADREQWVWRLAACQRGFDCSAKASWYEFSCRFDSLCQPGETGVDYIRRATANDFDSVQEEARALNANIEAGKWGELKIAKLAEPKRADS